MFDYDWFHGIAFAEQQRDARLRCAATHFSDPPREKWADHKGMQAMVDELEVRALIYLRDGFSYEIKQLSDVKTKSQLVFECMPVDEQYKVGAFVVSVPYEEIARVEVFAVHPKEKPEDFPQITGFRNEPPERYPEAKPGKREREPREPREREPREPRG